MTDCEQSVISKIRQRQQLGLAKYGVSVRESDESTLAFLRHAQEEAMDLAIYLERIIQDWEAK